VTFSRVLLAAALATGRAFAAEFTLDGRKFTVPDGFTVQRVTAPNLVARPISASFDHQGRLYVTESDGSNEAPEEQLKHPGARVVRLEDKDNDGVFDAANEFADKVMFPQGCLWHDGWVYVAAPPSIWRYRDSDGDGKAEQREEWFKGGTLTGCANDIHGPYLGPDGFIYWTKGAFSEQTHRLGNGQELKDRAAHIYRMRPDGTGLDVIMSGGMDNPVEVAFTAEGEAIFTSTFIDFSEPGFRDGIAHAVYGGVYGKVNDVLTDGRVKRTGPDLLHPFYQAGPAAECGLTRYESEVFGAEYRDNLFATTFNLHRVTRHVLHFNGASFGSEDHDFLVSDDVDFHPTDVLEDADGSLLVVNTGGWYKLCCPSSQLAKPDVLGAIYRVRKTGATPPADPRGLNANWGEGAVAQIASRLGDDRPAVRNRAAQMLAAMGTNALPLLQVQLKAASPDVRRNALWALAQINDLTAKRTIANLFRTETDDTVIRTALKAIAIFRMSPAMGVVAGELGQTNPPTLRVAFEAFGRTAVGEMAMMAFNPFQNEPAKSAAKDPFLEHSAIMALVEIAHPETTRMGFNHSQAINQRAALIALDQMPNGGLKPGEVVPFVTAADERLRSAALWVLGRHPEWGGDLASWFYSQLKDPGATPEHLDRLHGPLHLLTHHDVGRQVLSDLVTETNLAMATRQAALEAIAGTSLKEPPAAWKTAVLRALEQPPLLGAAIRAARVLNGDSILQSALRKLATTDALAAGQRLDALTALPGGATLGEPEFAFARSQLAAELPPALRLAAAGVLARAKLDPAQLKDLTKSVATAGPLELNRLLGAFDGGGEESLGLQLVEALGQARSAKALHPSQLKPHFAKFPAAVQKSADTFLASVDADVGKQAAQLDALLAELQKLGGDQRRGQAVFNGPKAACSACHRIGYLGGDVGPELTKIGEVRTERDLLEAIVFPSASFVRSYEPSLVTLKGGDQVTGLVRHESAEEVHLLTGPGAIQRIRRAEIEELRPGTVSVMPGGLDEQLTRQELADLLRFVKDVRWR
jgi:putative membrane-bound dehydrogenase-like protein